MNFGKMKHTPQVYDSGNRKLYLNLDVGSRRESFSVTQRTAPLKTAQNSVCTTNDRRLLQEISASMANKDQSTSSLNHRRSTCVTDLSKVTNLTNKKIVIKNKSNSRSHRKNLTSQFSVSRLFVY